MLDHIFRKSVDTHSSGSDLCKWQQLHDRSDTQHVLAPRFTVSLDICVFVQAALISEEHGHVQSGRGSKLGVYIDRLDVSDAAAQVSLLDPIILTEGRIMCMSAHITSKVLTLARIHHCFPSLQDDAGILHAQIVMLAYCMDKV